MYNECRVVNNSLKNQLEPVLQDAYLFTLKNAYTGYTNKSTLSILTHLYANYSHISTTDMVNSDNNIRSLYNSEEPLNSLVERLNKCVDFAVPVGYPVTETHIVRI